MYSYRRMWLRVLVLTIVTTSMCGLENEHEVSENDNLKHDAHIETQAASSLKELTESDLTEELPLELYRSIRFEPPQLDFGTWTVGTVRSHTVTLINHNRNRSVYLSSVSGKLAAFASSFFEAKMVPPNGNTTFDVVFSPREKGAISTSLDIHTSFGKLRFMVRGEGRECPYRLKPLVGIKAPLNATLMPEIHMYNPHVKALQILEVYSSSGQFQLELHSGNSDAPKGLWEIPPLTTKPVVRIQFQGYAAGNYSAYIRIKIGVPHNSSDSLITGSCSSTAEQRQEQILVVPVEFEILPQYGLYAVNPLLEFGRIAVGENGTPNILKKNITLKHSKLHVNASDFALKSITYISGLYVEGSQVIVLILNEMEDPVVRLNEKLKIELKDKIQHTYHTVELIIRAEIFKGCLHYDANKTSIFMPIQSHNKITDNNVVDKYDNGSHVITIRNDFLIPLAIYNITSQCNDIVKLSLQLMKALETGIVLKPGLTLDILVASSLNKQQEKDLKDLSNYKTAIYVFSNISNFEIPIIISTGRLFVTTQTSPIWHSNASVYTKELDLGPIPIRETSNYGFIIFQNHNFMPIKLNMLDFKKPQAIYYHLMFLGCIKAADINETNNYTIDLEKAAYKFTQMNQGDAAAYMFGLQPYTTEHTSSFLTLSTPYENITIHIKFTTALGRLEVDQEKLHFANCFPGKLCSSELSIRSTFTQPMHIKYINFTDSGLRFEDRNSLGSKIAPQSVTTVGRIYFRPSALCGSRCYIQQQNDESATFPSLVTSNSLNIPNFDEVELRRRTELYRHFKYYFQNMDFTMTTKEMKNYQLNLMIELQWPQLVSGRQILPAIEVNETHIYEVKISNPSDNAILIDYTLADPALAKQTRISLPLEVVVITPSCYLTDKEVFSFVNEPSGKPILIPGLSSITVPIKFQANFTGTICTLLHIRNNLTLYEGVWISAKTVQSQFRLGNRKPGSDAPLLFEITEQHLESACPSAKEKISDVVTEQRYDVIPQLISRRVFTARNLGELPMRIDGFWIGDEFCRGHGFQVTNCSSFELKANSSKRIEITFLSDFSLTRITRPLMVKTNLTYDISYTLIAQLPSKGLEKCELLMPRPPWEEKVRNAAIIMLVISFILVIVAVHIDYNNIIHKQTELYEAREKGTVHPTFNLRNIATRSIQNNNESNNIATPDNVQRNKTKVPAGDKTDNSTPSPILGWKKRNVKSPKVLNIETKPTITTTCSSSMSLAEMVSWTFGSQTGKKPTANNKNVKAGDQANVSNASIASSSNETKPPKLKQSEKLLLDKMDGDLKKIQITKKPKVIDKSQTKNIDKSGTEEVKVKRDDAVDNELKKEKNSPKLQTKTLSKTSSSLETSISKDGRDHKKSSELNNHSDNGDKHQNSAKENLNGRRLGKTPGRERRKLSAQNISPIISDPTSSSSGSSSTSSSCSSSHNAHAKRNERKTKVKAAHSLKLNKSNTATNLFPTSFSTSCSPTSIMSANIFKSESTNPHVDILTPWDCSNCSNHATFSDVLQKSQSQSQQQSTSSSTDLMQQGSLFDLMSPANEAENSEITEALTPKRSKNSASNLGPIGSRKSPSSTPVWEPIQSAIAMQIPRPLNVTSTAASTASSTSCYYPISCNFGYNDLPSLSSSSSSLSSSAVQQQQQQQQQRQPTPQPQSDIHSQLLALQRQLLEQQLLQQQQQQFLNSNALNSNWSSLSSPLWSPILGNASTSSTNSASSIFGPTQTQNSTWSLTPNSPSSPSNSLVRPPPGLEQSFTINSSLSPSLSSRHHAAATATTPSSTPSSASTFSNTTDTPQSNVDSDSMPMFNLFGGLSSIWNDNWKQAIDQQQQSSQNSE